MGAATALPVRDLRVEPGATATATMTVRNTGQVVDQFTIEILGDCAAWTQVTPVVVNLLPGADAEITINFAPPRDPHVPAGIVPFGIRVASREDPPGSSVAEGSVDVGAFSDVQVELVPRQSRGRRRARHQIAIDNNGNLPTTVEVTAHDEEEALDFKFDHRVATIDPGAAAFVRVIAKPEKRFFKGADRQHPFIVTAAPNNSAPVATRGTMTQRQLLPSWLIPAVAVLAALVIAAVVLYFTLLKPAIKSTADDAAKKAAKSANSSAAAAVSSAQMQASAAQSQASAAQSQASSAASVVDNGGGGAGSATKSNGSSGPGTPTSTGGTIGSGVSLDNGRATAFPLVASVTPTPNNFVSFGLTDGPNIPKGQVLVITAVVMQNPAGDQGTLEIIKGTDFLLQEGLANFRDLDYHFDDEPLVFTHTQQLQMAVNCQAAGTGGTKCTPSILFTGRFVTSKKPARAH